MRISRASCANSNRRRIEAAGSEFEHGLNLLPCHIKLLDDLLDARTCLKLFKHSGHGHPGIAEHPRATQSSRHTFDRGALRPIKCRHVLTLLSIVTPTVGCDSSPSGMS